MMQMVRRTARQWLAVRTAGTIASSDKPESGTKAFEEIPGPRALPLIGNLWRYFPLVGQYSFEKLHLTYAHFLQRYGFLVRELVIGDRVLVHVFHPADMRTVYRNEGRQPHRTSHRALEKYRRERPHIYSGPGLFPSNGEEWRRFRHLFQRLLMAPKTSEACGPALDRITDELVECAARMVDGGGEIDLQPYLFRWALECMGAIALDRRLGCLRAGGGAEADALVRAAHDIHRAVSETENSPLFHGRSYARLEAAQDFLAGCVERHMKEAMAEISEGRSSDSLLSQMLQVEGADNKAVFTMILDMFLAGIDTTAYTTAFALYNLARNPGVQVRLREELRAGDGDTTPYLQWVVKESLRVNPVSIGTGRVLPRDLVLSGYRVPAGTMVILQHQVASKRPEFFPEPDSFLPERWSAGQCGGLASSPFGHGPRLCIGMRFARKEMHLAVAKFVGKFELSYHHEEIDSVNRLINVPDRPLRLRLRQVPDSTASQN